MQHEEIEMSSIRTCTTDTEILTCFPVVHELRPHLTEPEFIARVRKQMLAGYRMVFLEDDGDIRAVAGYRVSDALAWGHFLYVDDLVVSAAVRGSGYGGILIEWLIEQARNNGCDQFHLDSGVHRLDAHRFYEQHKLSKSSYHFSMAL